MSTTFRLGDPSGLSPWIEGAVAEAASFGGDGGDSENANCDASGADTHDGGGRRERERPPRGPRIAQVLARGGSWAAPPPQPQGERPPRLCHECPPYLVLSDGRTSIAAFLVLDATDSPPPPSLPGKDLNRWTRRRGTLVRIRKGGWKVSTAPLCAGRHLRHLIAGQNGAKGRIRCSNLPLGLGVTGPLCLSVRASSIDLVAGEDGAIPAMGRPVDANTGSVDVRRVVGAVGHLLLSRRLARCEANMAERMANDKELQGEQRTVAVGDAAGLLSTAGGRAALFRAAAQATAPASVEGAAPAPAPALAIATGGGVGDASKLLASAGGRAAIRSALGSGHLPAAAHAGAGPEQALRALRSLTTAADVGNLYDHIVSGGTQPEVEVDDEDRRQGGGKGQSSAPPAPSQGANEEDDADSVLSYDDEEEKDDTGGGSSDEDTVAMAGLGIGVMLSEGPTQTQEGSHKQGEPRTQDVPDTQEVPPTQEVPHTQEVPPTQEKPSTKQIPQEAARATAASSDDRMSSQSQGEDTAETPNRVCRTRKSSTPEVGTALEGKATPRGTPNRAGRRRAPAPAPASDPVAAFGPPSSGGQDSPAAAPSGAQRRPRIRPKKRLRLSMSPLPSHSGQEAPSTSKQSAPAPKRERKNKGTAGKKKKVLAFSMENIFGF